MSATVALFVPHWGCPHQCSFCNQKRITGKQSQATPQDVCAVAQSGLDTLKEQAPRSELAFFGGSFTSIPRENMVALLEAAQPYLGENRFRGIRISTRPDAIDDSILTLLKQYGVTTVELGAQSMLDAVLNRNGRGHTAKQVEDSVARLKLHSFSVGLQMMTGLPGDSDDGARQTAEEFVRLNPDCVRIYPAITLKGTAMASWVEDGTYTPPLLEDAVSLCAELADRFAQDRIPVIRIGLHAIDEASYVGGPWHPAFGELVESRRRLWRLQRALKPNHDYLVRVPSRELSAWIGQHRCNVAALQLDMISVHFIGDDALMPMQMNVEEVKR